MSLFDINICRLCGSQSEPNIAIFDIKSAVETAKLSQVGEMMLDCLFAELTPNSGYPEVVCTFCQLQLNVFYEFKRKVFSQHAKFTSFIEKHTFNSTNHENHIEIVTLLTPDLLGEEEDTSEFDVESYHSSENELTIKVESCHSMDQHDGSEFDPVATTNGSDRVTDQLKSVANTNNEEQIDEHFLEYSEDTGSGANESQYEILECDENNLEVQFSNSNLEQRCKDESVIEMIEEFIDEDTTGSVAFNIKDNLDEYYECQICLDSFETPEDLKQHLICVHPTDRHYFQTVSESLHSVRTFKKHVKIKKGQQFSCTICQKFFSTLQQCKAHEFRHTNIRPLKCDICDKSFKLKCDLRIHMDCHNNVRKFNCEICGNAFRMLSHLNNHRETHNAVNAMECTICGMLFKTSLTLKSHIRQVHDTNHDFKCTLCDRTFYRRNKLERHIQGHLNKK